MEKVEGNRSAEVCQENLAPLFSSAVDELHSYMVDRFGIDAHQFHLMQLSMSFYVA